MTLLALAFLLCLLASSCSAASLPCFSRWKCLAKDSRPTGQQTSNPGKQCFLPDPDVVPMVQLDEEQGMYPPMIGHTINPLLELEITLQIRYFLFTTLACWNAITPWHPTATPSDYAKGFGLPFNKLNITSKRQAIIDRNIAVGYAYHRAHSYMIPKAAQKSAEVLTLAGFDPSYTGHTNLSNPADIGNAAAMAVIAYRQTDGWNQAGDAWFTLPTATQKGDPPFGADDFAQSYSDWTGYMPVNDAYNIKDLRHWQPLMENNGLGSFYQQTHLTPQIGWAQPWALTRDQIAKEFVSPAPWPKKDAAFLDELKKEADAVIAASANLTDFEKIAAEHFDVKPLSFGAILYGIYAWKYSWDLTTSLAYDLALPMFYDATLVAWRNKITIDAIRPTSAIRYMYGYKNITAYMGRGKGTGRIPGRKFTSYMRTMPHTDYPSGTACLCSAFAEFNERFIGSTDFEYSLAYNQGCSTREPGVTPAKAFTLYLKTKDDFLRVCSNSRLYAGVHFPKSIKEAVRLCKNVGVIGYHKAMNMLKGT